LAHDHSHHSHDNERDAKLLGRAFFLISAFLLVELIGGIMTNALVLLADAGHMFLDASALGMSWWAVRISQKGDDHRLSYGYHRFQVLAAFLNGLLLVVLVIWIAVEALSRVANPEPMLPIPALAVAVVGFVVNIIAYRWLHGASNSTNVQSAALHVMGDLLGSAAAILAALAVYFFGWLYADPILSLLIVIILSRGAFRVLRDTSHILLEGVPNGVDLGEIKKVLCNEIPHVIEIHHVHAWALTQEKPLLTLHAQVSEQSNVQRVVEQMKAVLSRTFGIDHSTIQIELGPCPDHQ
jgi:cobalt-zinc-cadmium efflux system protein